MAICEIRKEDSGNDFLWFFCDGCDTHHRVPVTGDHKWDWNGSIDSPTLHPSIKVSYDFKDRIPSKICHSLVTNGNIQYLPDCTHKLAGQIVPLPNLM